MDHKNVLLMLLVIMAASVDAVKEDSSYDDHQYLSDYMAGGLTSDSHVLNGRNMLQKEGLLHKRDWEALLFI
jgi:hypothetical protein